MGQTLIYISIGAALGASLRYVTGIALNDLFSDFNLGTLIANLVGCYLMGIVLGGLLGDLTSPSNARAFFVIGFLGSLTTFSSFTGEVILLFQQAKWMIGTLKLGLHVIGSLLMTVFGLYCASFIR